MATVLLAPEDVVPCRNFSGYNMSILGKPKMTVICGSCSGMFKSRDWFPYTNSRRRKMSIVNCPKCNKWNTMNFTFD